LDWSVHSEDVSSVAFEGGVGFEGDGENNLSDYEDSMNLSLVIVPNEDGFGVEKTFTSLSEMAGSSSVAVGSALSAARRNKRVVN
jgi:hypothetical protein